jgi:peptide/nickel transport system substrate-binding protein
MTGNRFGRALFAAAVAASMLLAACSSSKPNATEAAAQNQAGGKPEQKGPIGTFIYANVQDAKILNPILEGDTYSGIIDGQVFDGLMTIDDKAELKPNLAKSWEVAPDNRKITFHLRDDVKWHDGEKFTAKDVIFTFQAIMHPDYTGPRRSNYDALAGVKSLDDAVSKVAKDAADRDAQVQTLWENWRKNSNAIVAKDDLTVEVNLDRVHAPIMVNLAMGILPEHLYRGTEGKQMSDSPYNQKPVGTGPMKFSDWKKGDQIVLENNPDYKWGLFNKPYNLKRFVFKVVPDSSAAMAALENQEVDFAAIEADNWEKFTKLPNVQTFDYLGWSYQFIGYNFKDPIVSQKAVRQALTSALNRESIVKDLKRGHAQVANTHGAPGRWDYNDNVKKWPYDPAAAAKLLEDAGWKLGADGIREQNGKKLAITFTYSSGNKYLEQLATVIQQSWKQVGVDVKLEAMKFEAILDKMQAGEVQAFTLGWSLGVEPDAYSIFHSKGGFSWISNYSNPQVDQLLEQGRAVLDIGQRKQIYAKMQEILAEEQTYTWVAFNNSLVGVSKRVHGVRPSAAVGALWNMAEWQVDGE